MEYKYHIHINIEGAMHNAEAFIGAVIVDGKMLQTVEEVKQFFRSQLDLGRKILPVGDCDNFDYQRGCRGHEIKEDKQNG